MVHDAHTRRRIKRVNVSIMSWKEAVENMSCSTIPELRSFHLLKAILLNEYHIFVIFAVLDVSSPSTSV